MNSLKNFWREEQGQDVVEYSLLLAGVAIGTAAALVGLRTEISSTWSATNSTLVSVRTT